MQCHTMSELQTEWKCLSFHAPPALNIFKVLLPKQNVLTSHDRPGFSIMPFKSEESQYNCPIITFSHLVTLTFDLDHQTWPRYGPGRPTCQISCLYVRRFSHESADRRTCTQKHRHTGPILLPRPLTREVINHLLNHQRDAFCDHWMPPSLIISTFQGGWCVTSNGTYGTLGIISYTIFSTTGSTI